MFSYALYMLEKQVLPPPDGIAVLDDIGHQHERRVKVAARVALSGGRLTPHRHLAEIAGGPKLVVLGQFLLADAENHVAIEGITDRLDGGLVERFAQINFCNLGTECR